MIKPQKVKPSQALLKFSISGNIDDLLMDSIIAADYGRAMTEVEGGDYRHRSGGIRVYK
jgi:hypothetical protein